MFEFQGIFFPDGEKHFPGWMEKNGELVDGRGTYQIRKLRKAMEYVKDFRVAVDVGAHVGLWSMQLAKRFGVLHAFEPVSTFRECWSLNMQCRGCDGAGFLNLDPVQNHIRCKICDGATKWRLHPVALGASAGRVAMTIPLLDGGLDTGGTHVGGEGDIEMRTLDSFELDDVDCIKIDCEGYEHHVIKGAEATLLRCKPCVIVEQKPHKLGANFGLEGTPAVDMLLELGAKRRAVLSGDHILSWN